jgi:MATE family multidrug resistance protein
VGTLKEIKESWFLPDKTCFIGLLEFLKFGIPSAAMLCIEWWSFEIMSFLSGYISVNAMAAQVIVVNISFVFFMIPMGI